MPLCGAPGGLRAAPGPDKRRAGALRTQDTVPGRHHPCDLRALGLHGAIGGAGAQTQGEPDPLPRRVRPQQPLPCNDHPGQTWQGGRQGRYRAPCARGTHTAGAAGCHDLGQTPEARLQHRHYRMRKVQGAGEGDCLHRGPCGHRQDPQPPEGQGSQTSFSIHPTAATPGTALASRVGAGTGGLNQHTASTPTDITDDATYADCRGGVRMQERLEGRAASKAGEFGAIEGQFRASRGSLAKGKGA